MNLDILYNGNSGTPGTPSKTMGVPSEIHIISSYFSKLNNIEHLEHREHLNLEGKNLFLDIPYPKCKGWKFKDLQRWKHCVNECSLFEEINHIGFCTKYGKRADFAFQECGK